MSGTVHVAASWSDDHDGWDFWSCEPGEYDDSSITFEVEVAADVWERRRELLAEWGALDRLVAASVGLGDDGRLARVCAEWIGDEHPGVPAQWTIELAASDGSEWPVQAVQIGFSYTSAAEADAGLAALPDQFYLYGAGPGPVLIGKGRLSVHQWGPGRPVSYECHRCGWAHGDHPAGGAS